MEDFKAASQHIDCKFFLLSDTEMVRRKYVLFGLLIFRNSSYYTNTKYKHVYTKITNLLYNATTKLFNNMLNIIIYYSLMSRLTGKAEAI